MKIDLSKFKHQSWLHGEIVVINDDCFKVMAEINDKQIDLILTDPPYNTTACRYEWDIFTKIDEFWVLHNKIAKEDAAILFTGSNPFTSKLICSNLKMFKYDWIWDKTRGTNFCNLRNRPFKTHENVMVFSKTPNFTFNPIRVWRTEKSLKRDGVGDIREITASHGSKIGHYGMNLTNSVLNIDGKKHPIDIIKFSSAAQKRDGFSFPTKKPVALFEYLIKTYSNQSDLVFDGFLGSGTTAIACIRTKRRLIGCELDPIYFEKICERIEAQLKQGVLF